MAKTLVYSDGSPTWVKISDTDTNLYLQLAKDGTAVDLSTAKSIDVKIADSNKNYLKDISINPADLPNASKGVLILPLNSTNISGLPAGQYAFEVWVETADSNQEIYPDAGMKMFSIFNNVIGGTTVIAQLTLQQFEDKITDIEADLQSKINSKYFKGDKGDKGDKGAKGDKGDKGDTGLQGLQGDKGGTGPQGLQGIAGAKGDAGPQGLQGIAGAKGDKGDAGPQGPKGDTGPQGLAGAKGDKGDTGPKGLDGAKGDTGDAGPQGLQGPKGDAGPQGPQGDTGDISTLKQSLENSGATNLVYNSEYSNNGDGWNMSGVGYLSSTPSDMHNGSQSLGVNISGKGTDAWTVFGESKHAAVPATTTDDTNLFSFAAMVKIYENSPEASIDVSLGFFDSNGNRIAWQDFWLHSDISDAKSTTWQKASFDGYACPAGAVTMAIQYLIHGDTMHAVVAQPIITQTSASVPYHADTVNHSDISILNAQLQTLQAKVDAMSK